MSLPLHILILEDNPADAELMVYELQRMGFDTKWQRAETQEEYLTLLNPTVDLILADYNLPQFDGLTALTLLQKRDLDIPFILVSGSIGEELAVAAMKQGADDYILKDRLTRLGQAVSNALESKQLHIQKRQAEAMLHESETRYRTLIEHAADGIFVANSAGRYIAVNSAGCYLLGYTRAEILEKNIQDITEFTPHQLLQWQELRHGKPLLGEYTMVRRDGIRVGVEISIVQLPDGSIQEIMRDITERKQALEELLLTSAALEAVANGVVITDVAGSIEWVNPAFTALTGYSKAESWGRNPHDLVRSGLHDQAIYKDLWDTILAGQVWHGELTNRRKDKSLYTEEQTITPVRNSEGKISHFVAIKQDITERKTAENELAALYAATSFLYQADSLLNLGQQIAQAVVSEFSQADCGVLLADQTNNTVIQLARSGNYVIDVTLPFSLEEPSLIARAIKTGKLIYAPDVRQIPNYIADDMRTLSELVIPFDIAEGILGVLDLQSDKLDAFNPKDQRILTVFAERAAAALQIMRLYEKLNKHTTELERRVVERTAQLNHAKNRIESILNSSSDVIILCYTDGTINQVNPAFDEAFKCQPDEAFRQPLTSFVLPSDVPVLEHAFATIIETRQSQRVEITVCYRERITFTAEVVLSPVVEVGEALQGVVCILRDITLHKQMEIQLQQMLEEAMRLSELKTRYVSMAAHDLRNPLTVIQTSTEILQNYTDKMTDEQKQRKFGSIQSSIKIMVEMLDDILTIGQVESGKIVFNPAPLDLIAFCNNFLEELKQVYGTSHQIDFFSQGLSHDVNVDVKLLQHILSNLLSNAIKYSPEQGTVTFTVNHMPHQLVFRIQDQGIGVPPNEQARLFETFHRASNVKQIPGTGLGLAIVKQSVELHGGTITFESEEGLGTTFTVTLPQVA